MFYVSKYSFFELIKLANLFVPLYSTKPQGQGIGLSFCRNIIEQHNGVMELNNNDNDKKGVTVMVVLPKPSKNER